MSVAVKRLLALLLLLPAALLAAGPSFADSVELKGTRWKVVKLQGVEAPGPTLIFETDKVSGTSGCNAFWAGIEYRNGNAIDIAAPQSARVFCPGVMAIERSYFASLETVVTYSIKGGALQLMLDDGSVFVELERLPPNGP